ncbi:hypothetical protein GZH49_40390 [Nocardia terpenica]|uniref:terpene synthase family protein n=1 Tax=Nocardia terpenica TaxID=455432 RepID=UPI002FE0945E
MSSMWKYRFAADMAKYLYSLYLEAVDQAAGGPYDLAHLIEVRRDAIALRPWLAAGESAHCSELAFPIVLSEPFHRLRVLCSDAIVVQNDVYSLFKDLSNDERSSQAIFLIRNYGYTAEQSIDYLEQKHCEIVREYQDVESSTQFQAERYGVPEEKSNLDCYLSMMRSWMSGNNAWSSETVRYSHNVPSTWVQGQ